MSEKIKPAVPLKDRPDFKAYDNYDIKPARKNRQRSGRALKWVLRILFGAFVAFCFSLLSKDEGSMKTIVWKITNHPPVVVPDVPSFTHNKQKRKK